MKICKECGKENYNAEAKFCAACGGELYEKVTATDKFVAGAKEIFKSIKDMFTDKNSELRKEVESHKLLLIANVALLFIIIFVSIFSSMLYSLGLSVLSIGYGITGFLTVLNLTLFIYTVMKRSTAYSVVWLAVYTASQIFVTLATQISTYHNNNLYSHNESLLSLVFGIIFGFLWSIIEMVIVWVCIVLLNKFYDREKTK
jgi:hypothetical protein